MYLLFAGYSYYPSGGWKDFRGCYPSIEEAKKVFTESSYDWYHIVSGSEIIESGHKD